MLPLKSSVTVNNTKSFEFSPILKSKVIERKVVPNVPSRILAGPISHLHPVHSNHQAQIISRLHDRRHVLKASADDAAQPLGKDDWKSKAVVRTAWLGLLFAGWYIFNISFNIYNKSVLKIFPQPLTVTTVQFLVGGVISLLFWASGVVKRPTITKRTVTSILPLSTVHTLGNLLTNISLGAVAVSFTHTIKALEPAFSVVLSWIFLGDQPHPWVVLTLLPIMGGVAMASLSEATFNWLGFLSAMGSNLTFQSRNVLSKKLMGGGQKKADEEKEGPSALQLDNFNLFSLITIISAFLLLPITLAVEGWRLTPNQLTSMGVADPAGVIQGIVISGVLFHMYQQVSYMILERVTPVTHSIGNCVKRVTVIVASIIVFQNPVPTQNAIGTGIALLGVFLYSQVKRIVSEKKSTKTE